MTRIYRKEELPFLGVLDKHLNEALPETSRGVVRISYQRQHWEFMIGEELGDRSYRREVAFALVMNAKPYDPAAKVREIAQEYVASLVARKNGLREYADNVIQREAVRLGKPGSFTISSRDDSYENWSIPPWLVRWADELGARNSSDNDTKQVQELKSELALVKRYRAEAAEVICARNKTIDELNAKLKRASDGLADWHRQFLAVKRQLDEIGKSVKSGVGSLDDHRRGVAIAAQSQYDLED